MADLASLMRLWQTFENYCVKFQTIAFDRSAILPIGALSWVGESAAAERCPGCAIMISQHQHCDVFALLPESRPPWKKFLFSMGTQSLLLLLAFWVMLLHPHALGPTPHDYHFVRLVDAPQPINLTRAPTPPPIRTPVEAELKQPDPPAIKVSTYTKPKPPVVARVAPIDVQIPTKAVTLPTPAPLLPKPIVKTNVFSTGSSQSATLDRAPQKVQTGGFGDPHGVPANEHMQGRPVNIARLGSFDLPPGSGRGNGTGEAHGASGVVASSGFGNGTATGNRTGQPSAVVQQAGFGDSAPAVNQRREPQANSAAPKVVPAEILSKPTPAYTPEARKLRIEGEVLLEVVFEASGSIRVTRVVRGLGHGLDESAIQAAEQIRFKPALRDGQPSDSTGVLHIVFQLA